jgi:hypothetical protein
MATRLPVVLGPNGRLSELAAGDFVAQASWTKLATATASSSATIDFTDLSSSYNAYLVILSNVAPATDAVNFLFRTSTDGGSTYDSGASNYEYGNSTTTGAPVGSTGATAIQLNNRALGNASNKSTCGHLLIYKPSATQFCRVNWQLTCSRSDAAIDHVYGGGARIAAAAVNAIRFLMSSGNIASGQFDLYGLAA